MKHTDYLLEKYTHAYTKSTTHPFLKAAGDGSLAKETFTRWLRQDYLYAHEGYTRFASILLSRLPYPTASEPENDLEQNLARAKRLLIGSLSNIETEVDLFISTANEHNLQLFLDGQLPPTGTVQDSGLLGSYESATKSYVEFMIATAATGTIEEGLLLLWAMEKSYLDAWTYASKYIPDQTAQDDTQKAIRKLITNWSGDEMKGFVKECQEVYEGMKVGQDSAVGSQCENVFKRVIWLEQRFWPDV